MDNTQDQKWKSENEYGPIRPRYYLFCDLCGLTNHSIFNSSKLDTDKINVCTQDICDDYAECDECQNSCVALTILKTNLPKDILSIIRSYFYLAANYEDIKKKHDSNCSSQGLVPRCFTYDEKAELMSMVKKNNPRAIVEQIMTEESLIWTQSITDDANLWLEEMAEIAGVDLNNYEIYWDTNRSWSDGFVIFVLYSGKEIYSLQEATAHLISLINRNWWKLEEYLDKVVSGDKIWFGMIQILHEMAQNNSIFVKALDKLKMDIVEDDTTGDVAQYLNLLYLEEGGATIHVHMQKSPVPAISNSVVVLGELRTFSRTKSNPLQKNVDKSWRTFLFKTTSCNYF